MNSIKTSFFLFSTILYFTLLPQPNWAAGLVDQVCQQSHNKANCIANFASNPDSKTANLQQLGVIALRVASNTSTSTSIFIKKMLNITTLDPTVQQSLSDCSDGYIDANDQLDDSVAALLAKKYEDVRKFINAAIADAKSCEDSFTQNGAKAFPLKKKNATFRQLCNNALIVAKLLSQTKT